MELIDYAYISIRKKYNPYSRAPAGFDPAGVHL